jgi:hypothetical protein
MTVKLIATFLLVASFSSCATLFNADRQMVQFRGGQEKGVTKVSTPDGTFEVENGSGSFMMTRSKSNIPIKIMCPNGEAKNDIIETRFDWLKVSIFKMYWLKANCKLPIAALFASKA